MLTFYFYSRINDYINKQNYEGIITEQNACPPQINSIVTYRGEEYTVKDINQLIINVNYHIVIHLLKSKI